MAISLVKGTEVHQDNIINNHNPPALVNKTSLTGFKANKVDLLKGYFYSRFFLDSYLAFSLGL
jgi:hypothetical protein